LNTRDGLTYIKSEEEISDAPLSSGQKLETKIVKIPSFKIDTSDDDMNKHNPLEDLNQDKKFKRVSSKLLDDIISTPTKDIVKASEVVYDIN
jgi:hypothetical protein